MNQFTTQILSITKPWLTFRAGKLDVQQMYIPVLVWLAGAAVSIAMTVHWIANFAVGQLFLSAVGSFGISSVYMGFAAVCVVAALFVSTCIIETKGRSLEEIERAMA